MARRGRLAKSRAVGRRLNRKRKRLAQRWRRVERLAANKTFIVAARLVDKSPRRLAIETVFGISTDSDE